PIVTDLPAGSEFGADRGEHRVAAMRTTRGNGESSDSVELRPIFMELHVTPSLLFPVLGGKYPGIVARARRFDEGVVAKTPNFCDTSQRVAPCFTHQITIV